MTLSEAVVRILFKIPTKYRGWYWTEKSIWVFDYCDETITVNLKTWKGRMSYMAYGGNDVGHYFAETDWPRGQLAA